MAADGERLLDPGQGLAGQRHHDVGAAGILDEQRERISAHPGHGHGQPRERVGEPPRDGDEKPVADVVAQGVVDRLEPVEVDVAEADPPGRARTAAASRSRNSARLASPVSGSCRE